MLRKTQLIPIFILLLSPTAFAKGFYLGAGVGPVFANFQQESSFLQPGTANVKDTTHLSGTGVFGSFFGGYGWTKEKYYLAAELNADLTSIEYKSSNQEFVHSNLNFTHYKIQHSVGVSLLPGYLYTENTLFYARLGYTNGNLKITTNDSSLQNINNNLSGFRYGVGVSHRFTQKVSARMEYSHINYQRTKFTVMDGAITKSTMISPDTSEVEFGIIYNFE
jgi:outer membrane immunogenic protein